MLLQCKGTTGEQVVYVNEAGPHRSGTGNQQNVSRYQLLEKKGAKEGRARVFSVNSRISRSSAGHPTPKQKIW